MIYCKCGKAIDKLPVWLSSVNVEFICNNCPNRQAKNIAFMSLEPNLPAAAKAADDIDVEEIPDEEAGGGVLGGALSGAVEQDFGRRLVDSQFLGAGEP